MNGGKVVWLWQVTGGGQSRGVADTFGQAQEEAETCMDNGGTSAVVESARLAYNVQTMEQEYAPTGDQPRFAASGHHSVNCLENPVIERIPGRFPKLIVSAMRGIIRLARVRRSESGWKQGR